MPEYIRALIVILVLASVFFALIKVSATAIAILPADFVRRRNTWFLITLAGFLSQNYWIFVVALIIVVNNAAGKDSNKVALFFFLVLALPQINVEVPGFVGIRYLVSINYVKILTLILLLPVCIAARKIAIKSKSQDFTSDKILILYILLNLVLQARYDSVTGLARSIVGWIIDVIIPYYAISRSVKNLKDFRDILMSFAVAGMLASVVAIFEFSRRWLLYSSAGDALGVIFDPGYLARSDYLRALATSGQPIVLGCVIVVSMGFYAGLHKAILDKKIYWLGFALLVGGLLAPLSKGPWLGAIVLGLVFLITGTNVISRSIKMVGAGLIFGAMLTPTDFGQKIISLLPFVGDVDSENLTYRKQLFNISFEIILNNPMFGSIDYLLNMEELRQGQGIIDLVNTYLIIALNTGLIGLSLYLLFFANIGFGTIRKMKTFSPGEDAYLLGRAIVGTLGAFLLMIASVSPIYHITLILWSLAAFGLAYSKLAKE